MFHGIRVTHTYGVGGGAAVGGQDEDSAVPLFELEVTAGRAVDKFHLRQGSERLTQGLQGVRGFLSVQVQTQPAFAVAMDAFHRARVL